MNGQQAATMVSAFDGYFYQTVQTFNGKNVVVQTTRNPLQGLLRATMPDHVVIEVSGTPFYVRTQEIIWISLA